MISQPQPHFLPHLSKISNFSSSFSRTNKALSLSFGPFKAPIISLKSKPLIQFSKLPHQNGTSLSNESHLDSFAEADNELADAAGEVIRSYFMKKFEILVKEDLSPVTIVDQAEEEMVSIIEDNFCCLAVSTASPNLFDGDANQAFARVGEKVNALIYGCNGYTHALLASCYVDLVVESGLQLYDFLRLIPDIEDAGGVITDRKGINSTGFNVVAAGVEHRHVQALDPLQCQ